MKARARHTEGGGGQAGIEMYGPGAPASPSAMPLQHPSGRSPGSQAGVYPGAAPSRAIAQWRSAAPLLAYRCGGSAGIACGIKPRRAPASRFIPSDEGPPGHLKPAHYLRRNARLSIAMARPAPEGLAVRGVGAGHRVDGRSHGAPPHDSAIRSYGVGREPRSPRTSPGERGITGAPLKSFAFRVTR
jgi:hypothetical protein